MKDEVQSTKDEGRRRKDELDPRSPIPDLRSPSLLYRHNKCRRNLVCDYNGCGLICRVLPLGGTSVYIPLGCFLLVNSVANCEAVASFEAAACENLAAIGSAHAVTEAMLASFLAV